MERIKRVIEWLKDNDHSMAFIQDKTSIFYLTGFYCDPHERLVSLLLFPEAEPCLICPNMETSLVKEAGWTGEILGYSDIEDPWLLVRQAVEKRNAVLTSCIVEAPRLTYARVQALQDAFPAIKLIDGEPFLMELRKQKSAKELTTLKEAAALADYGVEVGVQAIQEGRSEIEILALIEYELKRKGVRDMSFGTLVLSGDQSANPHGNPGKRTIKKGDFVLFDLGVVLDGYCSDITRTVAFHHVTDQQQDIYETVRKAQQAALDACRPGVEIRTLDQIARTIITEAGYGDYFPHRIGHGLGMEVHELPSLNETNTDRLQKGMVFTIEPGIYLPSIGGVRIEDDVVITENGYQTLTNYPKNLQIIT